jgi:type VI secretion system secreted protein VgrG
MAHFAEQVHITIGDFTHNVVYYDLKLSQKMMDHHHFSFVWQYTGSPVIKPADQAEALRKYKGKEVIFTFKSVTGIQLMSKGIIQGLKSVDVNGSPVGLHVKGISHTILLDDMKKSRTFLDRSLKEIALKIFAEETAGEFYQREAIEPTYDKVFEYKPQYNETSFNFLKRLSARYGEWFYFDGMRIQLGNTKSSKVKLINGASLHQFGIETNLVSHKTSFGGYDYSNATGIRNSQATINTGSADSFAAVIRSRQAPVAQPDLTIGAYTNQATDNTEIAEMVNLQTAGRDANSVFYSGISYLPIGVGQVFTVQNQTVEHQLIAIEVIHHSEVHGNYTCEFKAIPADVYAPHYTDVEVFAKADSQPATIRDNNDPEGMGRVKVNFFWASGSTSSEWMRMIQPYAGAGRGIYFRPEIGDEVMVHFEGGNADCPYVSGSHYNGMDKSGYDTAKNDLKVIHTRSGCKILINDADGSILTEDKAGSKVFQNGKGNINLEAINDITFNAGGNISMTAGKNISSSAALDISESAGANHTSSAGATMSQSSVGNYFLRAFDINELAQGGRKSQAKNIQEQAGAIAKHATSENVNIQGQKKVTANGGENSNFH